jgi:anti-sigma B factor antagonist
MKLSQEERAAHTILRISGTLSVGDATRALEERFEKIAEEKSGALLLELSGLEHLDSTAIGVFVGGYKRFEAQGRPLYLVSPRERVATVLRITHLDSIFRVFGTVEEALKAAELSREDKTGEH